MKNLGSALTKENKSQFMICDYVTEMYSLM